MRWAALLCSVAAALAWHGDAAAQIWASTFRDTIRSPSYIYDSYTLSVAATRNFGADTVLWFGDRGAGDERVVLNVDFDSALPPGYKFHRVRVRAFVDSINQGVAPGDTISAYPLAHAFTEGSGTSGAVISQGVSHTNRKTSPDSTWLTAGIQKQQGGYGCLRHSGIDGWVDANADTTDRSTCSIASVVYANAENVWIEWDATAAFMAQQDEGALASRPFGVMFEHANYTTNDHCRVKSSDATVNPLEIVVDYTLPDAPPPSGPVPSILGTAP